MSMLIERSATTVVASKGSSMSNELRLTTLTSVSGSPMSAALLQRGALRPGETLLVHGAAGGVGLAAVQVGKLLCARVIATASSADKLAVAASEGADFGIDYRRENFKDGFSVDDYRVQFSSRFNFDFHLGK